MGPLHGILFYFIFISFCFPCCTIGYCWYFKLPEQCIGIHREQRCQHLSKMRLLLIAWYLLVNQQVVAQLAKDPVPQEVERSCIQHLPSLAFTRWMWIGEFVSAPRDQFSAVQNWVSIGLMAKGSYAGLGERYLQLLKKKYLLVVLKKRKKPSLALRGIFCWNELDLSLVVR